MYPARPNTSNAQSRARRGRGPHRRITKDAAVYCALPQTRNVRPGSVRPDVVGQAAAPEALVSPPAGHLLCTYNYRAFFHLAIPAAFICTVAAFGHQRASSFGAHHAPPPAVVLTRLTITPTLGSSQPGHGGPRSAQAGPSARCPAHPAPAAAMHLTVAAVATYHPPVADAAPALDPSRLAPRPRGGAPPVRGPIPYLEYAPTGTDMKENWSCSIWGRHAPSLQLEAHR